jgi:hypothetical protein
MANALKQKFHAAFRVAKPEEATADHDTDALRLGAETANKTAAKVLRELKQHANNPDSPFHRDALELLFNRAIPMKAVSSQAVRLLHSGALEDYSIDTAKPPKQRAPRRKKQFSVNVHVTTGPESDSEEV